MGFGNLGGLFENSGVVSRPNGNMRISSLAGEGTYAFYELTGPYGWGEYVYMPHRSYSWRKYNPREDTLETEQFQISTDLGQMCAVNGVTSGPRHYLTYMESTSSPYRVLDLETKTITTLTNQGGAYISKPYYPVLAENFIYGRDGRTSQMLRLFKFDLETQTKTLVTINYPKNIDKEIRSLTYVGDGIFYITFGNVYDSLSNMKDTSVTLLRWNERTGQTEIIAESIPIQYKYGPSMEQYALYSQHHSAYFTHIESDRIYMWLRVYSGSSRSFGMWVVLDINKKTYEILSHELESINTMNLTYTNDAILAGKQERSSMRELLKIEFQKD